MVKQTTKQLLEGFSVAGTYLFSQKLDAEGVAAMLGLSGAFAIQTEEGLYFMPGHSYDELMERIYSEWTVPDQATVPQTHPQNNVVPLMNFQTFLDRRK